MSIVWRRAPVTTWSGQMQNAFTIKLGLQLFVLQSFQTRIKPVTVICAAQEDKTSGFDKLRAQTLPNNADAG